MAQSFIEIGGIVWTMLHVDGWAWCT